MRLALVIALCASVALADDDSAFPDAILRWGAPGYIGENGQVILNAGHTAGIVSYGSNRVSSGSHIYYDPTTKSIAFSNLATIANATLCSFHSIQPAATWELQEYTIGAWVYWDAQRNDYCPILCKLANAPGNTSLFFGMDPGNKMRIVVRDSADRELLGPSALPATTWMHMMVSVRKSGSVTLYLDGVGVATNATLFTPPLTYDSTYHLNTCVYQPDVALPYNFSGKLLIDIVPRGLSDAEARLFYLESPRPQ